MNKIIEALNENLRVIYRKAVDADAALNALAAKGKGKFNTIFAEGSGFSARNKRFGPYVEELAGEVATLVNANQETLNKELPEIVKKIELMLTTLQQFKETIK
jgi:prefoldin subunit 5